jgi:hypothetical protein
MIYNDLQWLYSRDTTSTSMYFVTYWYILHLPISVSFWFSMHIQLKTHLIHHKLRKKTAVVSSVFSNPPVTYLRSRLQSAAGWPYSLGKSGNLRVQIVRRFGLRILLCRIGKSMPKKINWTFLFASKWHRFNVPDSEQAWRWEVIGPALILDVNCFPPVHNFSQATAGPRL